MTREGAILETTIAGSLPKPGWLAETEKLWPEWRLRGDDLERGNPMELPWLSGTVVRLGKELGVPTQVHGFICAVLKLYQRGSAAQSAGSRARRFAGRERPDTKAIQNLAGVTASGILPLKRGTRCSAR